MNLYLVDLVLKWIGFLFISLTSSLGIYKENKIVTENTNKNMSLNMSTEVISYETEIRYNHTKPSGEKTVLIQGENGYIIRNHDNGISKVIKNPVNEVVEIGTFVAKPSVTTTSNTNTAESFTGMMTMYYNCPNRSVCKTSSGYDLKKSVYYNDTTYGTVRILSAAQAKFPIGTIIEVISSHVGNFYGIVLDTGGDMIAAWRKGNVHIDLAIDASSEKAVTSKNVQFNVKRWGF